MKSRELPPNSKLQTNQRLQPTLPYPGRSSSGSRFSKTGPPLPNQSESLQYRLTIDQEGRLQSIIPLSARSQQQQETLNLPPTGEPVPQFPAGAASVVEIQFLPSGEVVITPITSPNPDAQE